MKTRIVKARALADALRWIGFRYTKDDDGNFVFERTWRFDLAWRDLHAMRSMYTKLTEEAEENKQFDEI